MCPLGTGKQPWLRDQRPPRPQHCTCLYRMKILRKKIDNHTGGGSVEVEPESVEDMWQLYNLIQCGDKVRAVTWRKVMHESTAGKASTAERVKIKLTVDVTSTNFDSTTGEIRCSGRNAEQHEHVKLGAYQVRPRGHSHRYCSSAVLPRVSKRQRSHP